MISCWDEANNTFTDVLNVHLYNSDFQVWSSEVFAECPPDGANATQCNRGAVVTEAGARWFEGMGADTGSPLTVVYYLEALKETGAAFVPGVALAWELTVGNSNTRTYTHIHTQCRTLSHVRHSFISSDSSDRLRATEGWSSGPPCVTPTPITKEPPIPWCGLLWPDGTPVSFTEAAAIRRYLSPTGESSFLLFDSFLPKNKAALTGDVVLNLSAGVVGFYQHFNQSEPRGSMVEMSFWLGDETHPASVFVGDAQPVGGSSESGSGWQINITHSELKVTRSSRSEQRVVATLQASSLSCGIPVGAWNLLRLVIRGNNNTGAAAATEETLELYLNPTADATNPSLGHVTPRLRVTEQTTGAQLGKREVNLLPPGVGEGYVLYDYISALPVDGGISTVQSIGRLRE